MSDPLSFGYAGIESVRAFYKVMFRKLIADNGMAEEEYYIMIGE